MKKLTFIALLTLSSLAQATEYEVINGHKTFSNNIYFTNANTGQRMETFYKNGKTYIAGNVGDNYEINICENQKSIGRSLYVVSVDGLNVISGEPANYNQTGYVISNGQCSKIKGWRKNMNEEAKFVLTSSSGSYAARTNQNQRNLGVIGFALFNEDIPIQIYESPKSAVLSQKSNDYSSDSARSMPPSATASEAVAEGLIREQSFKLKRDDKIGTGHGERIVSQARDTEFKRISDKPNRVIKFYYDSYENLISKGIISIKQDQPNPFPGERQFAPDPK